MIKKLTRTILTGDNAKLAEISKTCRNLAAKQPKKSLKEFYLSLARTAEKQFIINNSHKIFVALR